MVLVINGIAFMIVFDPVHSSVLEKVFAILYVVFDGFGSFESVTLTRSVQYDE